MEEISQKKKKTTKQVNRRDKIKKKKNRGYIHKV